MTTVDKRFFNGSECHLQKLFNYYKSPVVLGKDERTTGFVGWLALAAIVIAYDAYAIKTRKIETLTRSFWRSTEKKSTGSAMIGLWLLITFHLLLEKELRKKNN